MHLDACEPYIFSVNAALSALEKAALVRWTPERFWKKVFGYKDHPPKRCCLLDRYIKKSQATTPFSNVFAGVSNVFWSVLVWKKSVSKRFTTRRGGFLASLLGAAELHGFVAPGGDGEELQRSGERRGHQVGSCCFFFGRGVCVWVVCSCFFLKRFGFEFLFLRLYTTTCGFCTLPNKIE